MTDYVIDQTVISLFYTCWVWRQGGKKSIEVKDRSQIFWIILVKQRNFPDKTPKVGHAGDSELTGRQSVILVRLYQSNPSN